MKLILENWRKFVENQQPITLDESQLLPEILKFDLNEELLSEVDTDPEALSIDELKDIPAEEIISIYDQMIPKQTKADIAGARTSKRAQMSGELSKTRLRTDLLTACISVIFLMSFEPLFFAKNKSKSLYCRTLRSMSF